jgi:VWFA-related protein
MRLFSISKITAWAIPGIAALLFLTLQTTSAQAPAPQTPPTSSIKVATRLVTVEVIAQDKKNQPVMGLTKDDFELREDDQPQTISVFSVEGSMAHSAAKVAPPPVLPPGVFSNHPLSPSDVPTSATVILLDVLNTSASDIATARIGVGKFIEKMQPQDHVALFTMGNDLKMVHDFTNDSAVLLQALNDLHPERVGSGGPQLSTLIGTSTDDPQGADDKMATLMNVPRSDITLRAFKAIGEHIAGVPGRKTLIWISRGLPLVVKTGGGKDALADLNDMSPKVREASRVLSKYNVALYPMDTRGLNVGVNNIDNVTANPAGKGAMYGTGDLIAPIGSMSTGADNKAMQDTHDMGNLLAQLTGGRTYYDQNDLTYGIRSAIDDSRLVYVLGYYPAQDKWDSKFHTFKVRVKESGVKLTYRSGYLAVPEGLTLSDTDSQSDMDKAILAPLDSTAIGLFARIKHEGADGKSLTIDLLVDVNNLTLTNEGNLWKGSLEVVIAQLTSGEDMPANGGRHHSVELNLPDGAYTKMKAQGLQLLFPFSPDPLAVEVRVVVRDDTSGALGTVTIPFDKM